MKKIEDILKERIEKSHARHKKPPHHFHSPKHSHSSIFSKPLFCKKGTRLPDARVLPKDSPQERPPLDRHSPRHSSGSISPKALKAPFQAKQAPTRFFRIKPKEKEDVAVSAGIQTAKTGQRNDQDGDGRIEGVEALDAERIARLQALLKELIHHPGMMTPHLFWVLFMQIAPHFSLSTAGCVRVSALFWLMLSYIKAKNKNKKRKLKEQLMEAAEALEEEDASRVLKRRR